MAIIHGLLFHLLLLAEGIDRGNFRMLVEIAYDIRYRDNSSALIKPTVYILQEIIIFLKIQRESVLRTVVFRSRFRNVADHECTALILPNIRCHMFALGDTFCFSMS